MIFQYFYIFGMLFFIIFSLILFVFFIILLMLLTPEPIAFKISSMSKENSFLMIE